MTSAKRFWIVLFACLAMLAWLLLFGAGVLVNSQPYRDALAKRFDFWLLLKASAAFTPTNVAGLAMITGFLGGCASLLLHANDDEDAALAGNLSDPEVKAIRTRLAYLKENPIASALRGFVAALTFLAGTVLGANEAFATTTQDQYCRMAGAVAILAFTMGYDPTIFRNLISALPKKKES